LSLFRVGAFEFTFGQVEPMLGPSKTRARRIKRDVIALWIAAREPRTPLDAKLIAGAVTAYALSPVDLIPDFIPVLGISHSPRLPRRP
jgi:hypothetical protein